MEIVCLDSSVLIEYYRKKEKSTTLFFQLATKYQFAIPTIVEYEILRGDAKKDEFWQTLFNQITSLPFDRQCAAQSAGIYQHLRSIGKLPGTDDILIAATALANGLRLATLNAHHFADIPGLELAPLA